MTYEEYRRSKGTKIEASSPADNTSKKISYAEYRQQSAAKKISDFQAAAQQYFSDYQSFADAATRDSQNIGFGNAASMLESRIQKADDLRKKGDALYTFLEGSGDILSGDHTELLSQISESRKSVDSIMGVLGDQAKHYSNLPYLAADYYDSEISRVASEMENLRAQREDYINNTPMDWTDHASRQKYTQGLSDIEAAIEKAGTEKYQLETGKQYQIMRLNPDYAELSKQKPTAEYGPNLSANAALIYAQERNFYDNMTQDQIADYNYLYAKEGKEAADKYVAYISSDVNARIQAELNKTVSAISDKAPITSSLLSTPIKLMGGIGLVDVGLQKLERELTGSYEPIDYNTPNMAFTNVGNAIRDTVSQKIADSTGVINIDKDSHPALSRVLNGKSLADVYQLGMSMQDSAAIAGLAAINPVLGKVGTALLSTTSGTDAMLNAVSKGASDEQALTMGILAAGFEMIFEKYELESLLGQGKNIWQALWKQGLSEAVGEGATEAANILSDVAVMAEKSDWQQNIARYLAENPDWDYNKAVNQAFIDAALQVGDASIGGWISGSAMGGGYSAIQNIADNAKENRQAYNLYGESQQELVTEALELNPDNLYAQKLQGRLNNNKQLSGAQLRKLAGQNDTAIETYDAQTAAADRLNELGEQDQVDTVSRAIAKKNAGKTLTRTESEALRTSQYGGRVLNELSQQLGYSPEWTSRIGQEQEDAEVFVPSMTTKRSVDVPSPPPVKAEQRNASISDITDTPTETASESRHEVSTSGQTVQKSTGEAVTIREIASVKDGKMTFRAEDGTEVDAEDVSFASEDEASIYEAVAELCSNANAANLLVDAYRIHPIGGDIYARGIREAYSYGQFNISNDEMLKRGSFVKELSDHQRNTAYKLGQIFAGKQISREVAAINQRKKNGQKTQGAVHFNGDRSRLNDAQRAGLDAMELLAKGLGIQFYVFESQVDSNGNRIGENGWYDPKDGSIHVDLYAGIDGKGTILFTVAHELTHYIRQWSPAKFKILANYLMEQYGKRNVSVDELIADQIAKAERTNRTIDRDEAFEELVADSMETMLNSGNVLQMMADMKQRDRTLWEKICDWFKDFADKLKNIMSAYGDVKPDSTEGRIVADMQDATVILEALYGDALLDAAENFDAGAQKNTAVGGVKYSSKAKQTETEGYAETVNMTATEIQDGKEIAIFIDEVSSMIDAAKRSKRKKKIGDVSAHHAALINKLMQQVKPGFSVDGYELWIDGTGASHIERRHGKNGKADHSMATTEAKILIPWASQNADSCDFITDPQGNIKHSSRFLNQDGSRPPEISMVKQLDDDTVYISECVPDSSNKRVWITSAYIKKGSTDQKLNMEDKSSPQPTPEAIFDSSATTAIVAPPPNAVNGKMSASDSAGNQLSEAQQEYFRDSQIRDKEGRLLVLYHQTDGDFTIFDTRHAGAGNNDSSTPFGIFLKRSAGDIGLAGKRQMALYANIKNPLRATNRENLDRQLREFSSRYATISDRLKNLDVEYQRKIDQAQTAWNDYVKKWREANPNAKRTDLYGDPKFNELFNAEDDLVDEWTATSNQLSVQAKEIVTEDLINAGYDGIFLEEDVGSWGRRTDAIIALDPEQVKDINNQNPTVNPDIRYSTRDPAQRKIQEALQEENTQLREDVSRLEELIKLQRTVTGRTKFTKTSVIAAARLLKKYANVKRMADTSELAQLLHTFYEAVASDSKPSWDKIKEWAKPAVQWLQDHVDLKEERSEYAKTILDQMKGSRIYLDESQRAEAAYRFGSYNDFRKALFGRITFVDKGENSLDSWWHSMADMFPDVFRPDTTSTDMPGELFDIIDQLKNADTSRVEYEYNRASIAMDLTRQVYDSYWRVSTLHTVADRAQEKVDRLRYKHYQQMTRLRTEKNAKIDRIIAENRAARERSVDSRRRTEARHKILRVARELDALLRREDKKHHVPDSMKKAVAAALDLLELDTVNAAERIADYDARIAQATDQITIDALTVAKERVQSQGEKIGERLKELHAAYAEIMKSTDPDISAGYDPVIDGNLQELAATIGDTPFSRLSLEQLEDVYSMYKMVLTRVRDANKSLADSRNATISQRSLAVIRQIKAVGGSHKYLLGSGKTNAFAWNNLKPIYAIEKLGSPALKEAFWSLIEAEGGYARDINQAAAFSEKMRKDYGYDKWDMKKKYSFTSTSGIDFELTLEQIMSLYAFSRREQALDHLRIGGFVFDSSIETYKVTDKMDPETGEKKQKRSILKYRVNTADAHQLSQDILADIVSVLDPKQSEFVEKMQAYLSDTMGAKGNEVSMAMYGIKLFKEKHYWPLKSSNSYMFQQNETAGEVRIKNAGFTQKTKPNANNPIVLQNFMDVWAGHIHDMSMYHSFTLPLEDFNRIFNFATPRKEGQDPAGVKMTIQNAYGKEAVDYVRQMIIDLNGGARNDTREGMSKLLMGRFKKAAVAASLSVAIQQPSALNRAKALIPDKYFVTLNPRLLSTGKLWEECKAYAPVAVIKEMGKFDMDTGIGTINYIKAEKKGVMDVIDGVTGWLPAKADEWTWVQIWAAVKKETAATRPDLTVGSEAFLEAAGKRFTEIIAKTQVYDSTLSRSGFMRSKSGLLQMTTAFMAEPTTSINMIEHAIWQAKRGYRQASLKTCRAVLDSVIANAVLVSLVYALRDDDEDETFVEKYFGALTTEIIDGLNPLTYIPWVKDVWSIAQGFDVERSDMSLFADIADSISTFGKLCAKDPDSMNEKELSEHKRKVVSAVWGVAEQVANFFGLPVRNVRREIMAAINTFKNARNNKQNGIVTNPRSFWAEVEECMRDTVPVLGWFNDSKSDQVYDVLVARDTAQTKRLMNTYRDKDGNFNESAYHSAIRKGLRENDPRVLKASKARLNGDHTTANKLLSQIAAEGRFARSDISAAITAEYNNLKDD